ncbi:hypothetical protein EV356DRAFT_509681 [Viridothelium virens]|uniref:Uncharacterized protein n=1 Tax=Viridothelium virens TaxID=1048519 RepID=A0A6A6HIU5_VIRVR|nr:hypothetical protein EV356DRAFT_509681 [Viridothelium virens]
MRHMPITAILRTLTLVNSFSDLPIVPGKMIRLHLLALTFIIIPGAARPGCILFAWSRA